MYHPPSPQNLKNWTPSPYRFCRRKKGKILAKTVNFEDFLQKNVFSQFFSNFWSNI
jgi:hypothetical protein